MTPTSIRLADVELLLLPEGALFIPATRTLVVADLHLEKGTSQREFGHLLPPYDTALTLARLVALVAEWQPERLIALGDSFHDQDAASRLSVGDRHRLLLLSRQTDLLWIIGNHDPAPATNIPGLWLSEYSQGRLFFRHIPSRLLRSDMGEIAGHFHPKKRFVLRGHSVSRACFIADERRLILPAFGTYTGGLDVKNPAIATLFAGKKFCFLLGKNRLYKSVH